MNSESFITEYDDSAEFSEILKIAELLERLPDLIAAQIDIKHTKKTLNELSSMFKDLSTSKELSSSLKHRLLLLEAKIASNERSKDNFLQLKRAKHEILKVENYNAKANTFTKIKVLKKEQIAIVKMREKLLIKDIVNYLNERYDDNLKKGKYLPFTNVDVSSFLKTLKENKVK